MSYKKELLNMSRRLDQVQLKENPPELKMVVADENKGESLPEVEDRNPWSLYLKIEQKV
jgi:hypothetical protein|tara:strand:+ start:243 stop:419 length:177 start_codon:yes stop_codon:yes gene_type:complete